MGYEENWKNTVGINGDDWGSTRGKSQKGVVGRGVSLWKSG